MVTCSSAPTVSGPIFSTGNENWLLQNKEEIYQPGKKYGGAIACNIWYRKLCPVSFQEVGFANLIVPVGQKITKWETTQQRSWVLPRIFLCSFSIMYTTNTAVLLILHIWFDRSPRKDNTNWSWGSAAIKFYFILWSNSSVDVLQQHLLDLLCALTFGKRFVFIFDQLFMHSCGSTKYTYFDFHHASITLCMLIMSTEELQWMYILS